MRYIKVSSKDGSIHYIDLHAYFNWENARNLILEDYNHEEIMSMIRTIRAKPISERIRNIFMNFRNIIF